MLMAPINKLLETEVKQIAQRTDPQKIVRGKNYVYFSIQPSQEEVTFARLGRRGKLTFYSVNNFRSAVIGYLVCYREAQIQATEFGVAFFYSKKQSYQKLKVDFSDSRFRLLSFDSKDYFASVKWKSGNQTEAI
jgi:hypothetical protein